MFEWITNLMNSLGYFAVVVLMFLENIFPPIPSELIMPLAGYTVTKGKLTFVGVVLAGTLGSVLGALPLYYLGKFIGEERLKTWADQHGKWLTVSREDIEQSRSWFDRHGSKAVFLCRLVPGVRSLISLPAGINNMNFPAFLLYSALGAGLWSALLTYLGLLLGANYASVDRYLGPASYVVFGIITVIYVVRVVRQHQKEKNLAAG